MNCSDHFTHVLAFQMAFIDIGATVFDEGRLPKRRARR